MRVECEIIGTDEDESRSGTGTVDDADLDKPLSTELLRSLNLAFDKHYNVRFPPMLSPDGRTIGHADEEATPTVGHR